MRREYADFLQSWVWGRLREEVLERAGDVCEVCGATGTLHVHHRWYTRVGGNERLDDLIVLCAPCHKRVHELARERRPGQYFPWKVGLRLGLVLLRLEVRNGN